MSTTGLTQTRLLLAGQPAGVHLMESIMLKWFKNRTKSNEFGDKKQVCIYCGRYFDNTMLKKTGTYYSCTDHDSCLAYQNRDLTIRKEIDAKKAKIESNRRAEQEAKKERDKNIFRKELYDRNEDLIGKFLQIAERKVSVIDDYGDENDEALPGEILTCLKKIAQREKVYIDWKRHAKDSSGLSDDYVWLKNKLHDDFWAYHLEIKTKTSSEYDLNTMSGEEFETWIMKLLKENGFDDVSGTPKIGDQGADIIAKRKGKTVIVQAKRHKGTVSNKAVQEVIGAMHYYNGDEGWVITNSIFTPSAIALAQKSKIKLIDGKALSRIQDFITE